MGQGRRHDTAKDECHGKDRDPMLLWMDLGGGLTSVCVLVCVLSHKPAAGLSIRGPGPQSRELR